MIESTRTEPTEQQILDQLRSLCKTGAARSLRLEAGLSIRQAAELVGIPPGQLSEWETNRAVPSWGRGVKPYCDLLGGIAEWLVTRDV